ncbi:helix-turn-helix domain-containing protein [Sinorhizobium meliloti]|uniref:helix-turn-helix domain-containing protein n=1 Tax=Rhizobium meliloti TaxID=382 RepID=UPI003D65873A
MTAEIVPADFPGLEGLCWNRSKTAAIDRETAWALYRANWRFVWQDTLTDDERVLIESLEVEFGNGERLLGSDGPPPAFARLITPEQAAEILGIDHVLLERRIRAGRLSCHKIDGQIRISLADVLALKETEDKRNALMAEIYEDMDGIDKPPNEPRRKM